MITAKLMCVSVEHLGASPGCKVGEKIKLIPVYTTDPNSPNHSWAKATPSGSVELMITNPAAFGKVEAGKEYLVKIESA